MMSRALRSTIFCFLSILLLTAAFSPAYGGGGAERDLVRADALINNKEYEEAMQLLTNFARRNPDRFDLAHSRLHRIFMIREDFNRTSEELINTVINDPENDGKINDLTTHLYSLEKEDSPILVNFLARYREVARLNENRYDLRSLLARGREFMNRGDIAGAMQTYADGMSFMRDEFFAGDFGEAIDNEVRRETERVNSALAVFQQASLQMQTISAEYVRAVNAGELTRIPEIYRRLASAMDRFIQTRQNIYTAANSFDRILRNIRASGFEISSRNHLSMLSVIIRGRTEENTPEGMLGAFETVWDNTIGSCINAIIAAMERTNAASIAHFKAGEYPAAAAALNRTENYFNLAAPFFDRSLQFFRGAAYPAIVLNGNTIIARDIPPYTKLMALNEAGNLLRQAANTAARHNFNNTSFVRWQEGSINADMALNNERQQRTALSPLMREIDSILTRGGQINREIRAHHEAEHMPNTLAAIETLRNKFNEEDNLAIQRYFIIANLSLQNSIIARRAEMERGRNFLNGETRTNVDGVVTVFRYPSEALAVFTPMLAAMTAELENGNALLARHRNEQRTMTTNEEVSNWYSIYQSNVNELTVLRNQGIELAEAARLRSTQAEAYRIEGNRLLREAQVSFQRQDFETARDRVQRASDRIALSLEIQESAALRAAWDTQVLNLGHEITRVENEQVITDVRSLLNSARTSYFAGDFQQAEDSLIRARNRWRVTNSGENEEVLYWLGIIRTALFASSGRVIPPTAPLFAEMSQLLSQAQRRYEEGVRYMNEGRRTQGLARFNEAQQLAREVKLIFPLNQEAGLLELRIERFMDPVTFNASFEQRLRTAIAGTRQRSIESFADLQNLAEINPGYPNIRAIITQAEIDMGFRQPPPSPANIARSRDLTAYANRILNGNVTALFETALAQTDEAIALNPQNTEATRIKDRLLSRMSVPGAIVLAIDDEEIYQRAMRELQAGNNLVANALVERLMRRPENRNITKLVELQRRIQLVL